MSYGTKRWWMGYLCGMCTALGALTPNIYVGVTALAVGAILFAVDEFVRER